MVDFSTGVEKQSRSSASCQAGGRDTLSAMMSLAQSPPAAAAYLVAMRARFVGLLIAAGAGGLLIYYGAETWRVVSLVVVVLGLLVSITVDWRGPAQRPVSRLVAQFGVIILLQAVGVWATGAINSPFVAVFIPVVLLAALVVKRRPLLLGLVGLALAMLTLMAVTEMALDNPVSPPWFLDRARTGVGHTWGTVLFTLVLGTIVTVGSALGIAVRATLERSQALLLAAERQHVESAKERNRELQALLGELAHELKNPLHAIGGLSSNMLRKAEPGTRDAQRLSVLVGEVKRMSEIVTDYLKLSRPVGQLRLSKTQLGPMTENCVLMHQALAQEAGVSLVSDIDVGVEVECDGLKIKQVVINLLHNAIEALPDGGDVQVRVRETATGASQIIVEDSGMGFVDDVEQAFTLGVTSKPDGSGIGLTISRAIARSHGGDIHVDSSPGGTRVCLELPNQQGAKQ